MTCFIVQLKHVHSYRLRYSLSFFAWKVRMTSVAMTDARGNTWETAVTSPDTASGKLALTTARQKPSSTATHSLAPSGR